MRKIIFLLMLLLGSLANATEGYEYINSVVEGLSEIQLTASQEKKKIINSEQDVRAILMSGMQSAILIRNSIKNAKRKIERFKSSNDELIANSSKLLVTEYLIQEKNYQRSIDIYEKYLNYSDNKINENQGTLIRERTEISNEIGSSWDGYQKSAMTLTYAMINASKVNQLNGKINKLKITKSEVSKVNSDLETYFGMNVKKQMKDEDSSVMIVAKMIYQFINSNKFSPLSD